MDLNIECARPDWPPVVVAGGFTTGVVLMRDLHRRGLRVYCIDTDARQPAFSTIYGAARVCPDPDRKPGDWLQFMIALKKEIAPEPEIRPVLIASADRFVEAVAGQSAELNAHFSFCYDGAAIQGLLATKKRQYEIASEHGLPVPRTQFVRSVAEVRDFAAVARFPCLIKPLHFREWKAIPADHPLYEHKLVLAPTAGDLETQYLLAAGVNPEVVVQEIIEGPDENKLVYLSCYSRQARRIGWCVVRQIRTDPVAFGSASVVEPVADPETSRICDEFLLSLGYMGVCEIELKRDARDGIVKMIEANPRYSVTADAARYAGVDIGWLHYLDLIGQPVVPVEPEPRDFRHICLFRDVPAIYGAWGAGLLTWRGLLASYRRPVFFFDFDIADRRLALRTAILVARLIAGPVVRRFFRRPVRS